MRDFDTLVAEAVSADMTGWGFDWLEGRAMEERPPWGFATLLAARIVNVRSALDLDTGGGEVLSEAPVFPERMIATEASPPHGQEDQLGALGLVVNAIVLWNTRYQDAALNQLLRGGFDVRDEDVQRLSPLGHEHINLLGSYQFSDADLTDGQLRPLREPTAPEA